MSVASASYQVEWKPAGSWVDVTAHVLEVSGGGELTGNRDNALAFGDSSQSRATVVTKDALGGTAWKRTPIRITFSINGNPQKAFAGIIESRDREGAQLSFDCVGYAALIQATKAYSGLFEQRPVATKTTTTSIEDPTGGGYRAGLINYILWTAGGRPLEQAASYPSASFYYQCDQAALAPTWSWVAGEDGWAECLKLAQASGGQIYQDRSGTVRYRQPYGYGDETALYLFDENVYAAEPAETASAAKLTTSVRCTYQQRTLRPMQKVVEDSTARIIPAGAAETIVLEPSWPITSLELEADGVTVRSDALVITIGGAEVAIRGTHYSATASAAAQQVTLTITNLMSTAPLVIWSITLKGTPIMASEGGSVVVGSGSEQRTIDDNPYIQSAAHAKRLAQLYLLYYGDARPVRSIKRCVYDPDRTVGEVVNLTVARWSLTAQPHIILSISHDDTGLFADYELAFVGDLPKASQYFQVGPSYSGQSRRLTF